MVPALAGPIRGSDVLPTEQQVIGLFIKCSSLTIFLSCPEITQPTSLLCHFQHLKNNTKLVQGGYGILGMEHFIFYDLDKQSPFLLSSCNNDGYNIYKNQTNPTAHIV